MLDVRPAVQQIAVQQTAVQQTAVQQTAVKQTFAQPVQTAAPRKFSPVCKLSPIQGCVKCHHSVRSRSSRLCQVAQVDQGSGVVSSVR